MIGQARSSFNIREVMDNKKIMIINLSKGRVGETNANLLGGMLITKIYLAALSRADVPDRVLKGLPNFYLFVDEFQSFANESFADILSEARKYKLNLTMAHQYIEQMEEEVRAAVFGNVGTMIVFRVGAYDAEILEKEFAPQFTAEDIVNLGFAQIYLKLMIDGISSQPFSATTLGPIAQPAHSLVKETIELSRRQFAHPRAEVEKTIAEWHEPVIVPPKPRAGTAARAPAPAPIPMPAKPAAPIAPTSAVTPAPASPSQPAAPTPPPPIPPAQKTQQTHQPFKEAIKTIKPVPLTSLAPKKPQTTSPKDASPERVSELRNALASVLNSQKKPESKKPAPETAQSTPLPQSPKSAPPDGPQEVSEDVLKSVLKVE
jgi:hypothetical protein